MPTTIYALAADHGGFALKEEIRKYLDSRGVRYIDFGTDSAAPVDYPPYAHLACAAVLDGRCGAGILCCGTGNGMAMTANKHRGIRCVCCSDVYTARYARLHNDANMLALGGRVVGPGLAQELVAAFVDTQFEGGRHAKRLEMVEKIERENGG